jgi:hypothetical protein
VSGVIKGPHLEGNPGRPTNPYPLDERASASGSSQVVPSDHVTIDVRDALTGQLVAGVLAVPWVDDGGMLGRPLRAFYPDAATLAGLPVHARTPGRILLPPTSRCAWVRAPGYAWQAVLLPEEPGGSVDVRLVRGGSALVKLQRWGECEGVVVFLAREEVLLPAGVPDVSGDLVLEGLPLGDLQIRAVQGRGAVIDPALAAANLTVLEGRTVEVSLDPNCQPRVRSGVTVVLALGDWSPTSLDLSWRGVRARAIITFTVHGPCAPSAA